MRDEKRFYELLPNEVDFQLGEVGDLVNSSVVSDFHLPAGLENVLAGNSQLGDANVPKVFNQLIQLVNVFETVSAMTKQETRQFSEIVSET